jgi:transcriptional regulator with GAF, ATPase, and Fis domain
MPPLRERGRDVLLLAGFFLKENRSRLGLLSTRLAAVAQAALLRYPWPGNGHELEHLIGRSALKALAASREHRRILTLSAADFALSTARMKKEISRPQRRCRASRRIFAAPSRSSSGASSWTRLHAISRTGRRSRATSVAIAPI